MKIEGLLPIGSVIMPKGGSHRLMIIGYGQRLVENPEQLYDYVGCPFPEGFLNAEHNFLFNRDQIERIDHMGHLTEGQMAYAEKIEEALAQARNA